MSADNWGICPCCLSRAEKARDAAIIKAGESYGTVKPEEFMRLNNEANKPVEKRQTLREDYELGIDEEGHFYVSYRGGCDVCGYSFSFKHDCDPPMPEPQPIKARKEARV